MEVGELKRKKNLEIKMPSEKDRRKYRSPNRSRLMDGRVHCIRGSVKVMTTRVILTVMTVIGSVP